MDVPIRVLTDKNPLSNHFRSDLRGRFSELSVLKEQWARVYNTMEGAVLPPYEVLIHPSSICNLSCLWCIGDHVPIQITSGRQLRVLDASKQSHERLPDHLGDVRNMMRVVDGIVNYHKTGTYESRGERYTRSFGIEAVSFSGLIGEPLVSKKAVMAAMERLVLHGLRVGMFTNAVLMDVSTWETILQTAYVLVSVDAATGETYGRLKYGGRHGGAQQFQMALKNVENLVRLRSQAKECKLAINAAFILYPENYHEVYDAAKLLKSLGVDCLRIKQDISGGRQLSPDDRVRTLDLLDRIDAELVDEKFNLVRIHSLTDSKESTRTFSRCTITDLVAAIGSDGHMYPCNYHPRPGGASYGSVVECTFQEVWEGAKRRSNRCKLPKICPKVCDPFKNRSNRLLEVVANIWEAEGPEKIEGYISELMTSI